VGAQIQEHYKFDIVSEDYATDLRKPMILLAIAASWMVVILFVAVLCIAAQRGDARAGRPDASPESEQPHERAATSPPLSSRPVTDSERSRPLVGTGGAAR
jgi:hypothetical protein